MGRKTLNNQIQHTLTQKARIGESRHKAKEELKQEYAQRGEKVPFGTAIDGIHSIKTYDVYREHCERFASWCIQEKGVNKYTKLEDIKQYATEYLKDREAQGKSLYTLKAERAALGKLYGEQIECKFENKRSYKDVTRSRGEAKRDAHFSEEKNAPLVALCRGTGGRREDIGKLTPNSFFTDKNGNMFVRFEQSKGGRDRVSPVLPKYQEAIRELISTKAPNELLFDKIHNGCDVHGYRREYAQELYQTVCDNKDLKAVYAAQYAPRSEKNIKGEYYIAHDKERPFKGLRDNIYIVSEALGHNRLDVSVNHYLK